MSWVKCSERLPDESRPEVLFYCKAFERVEIGKYNNFTNKWMLPFISCPINASDVTHWQPLPEPPIDE